MGTECKLFVPRSLNYKLPAQASLEVLVPFPVRSTAPHYTNSHNAEVPNRATAVLLRSP